eukprot:340516-Rhodomonas_salina.2
MGNADIPPPLPPKLEHPQSPETLSLVLLACWDEEVDEEQEVTVESDSSRTIHAHLLAAI